MLKFILAIQGESKIMELLEKAGRRWNAKTKSPTTFLHLTPRLLDIN